VYSNIYIYIYICKLVNNQQVLNLKYKLPEHYSRIAELISKMHISAPAHKWLIKRLHLTTSGHFNHARLMTTSTKSDVFIIKSYMLNL